MTKLFEKGTLKSLEIPNRTVMAPMCTYSADELGFVKNWHLIHYTNRAIGGVGLILLEATSVEPRGRISGNDLGIWSDEHIAGLKSLVDEAHHYGSKIGIQLAHAGRKCGVSSEQAVAPSGIAFSDRYQTPNELTVEDIKTIVNAFKEGARRAQQAGFDTIEIHGAHGYLINQFLSPLSNKRTDAYGGSLENRVRFLKEILDAVATVWPEDLPIIVRLSADEYHPDGHHIEETIQVINLIKDKVDLINVSSGGVVHAPIEVYPGYQLQFSQKIKEACGVQTIAGGLVTDVRMIEEVLHNHRAVYVYLGRELLRNPYFVLQAAKTLNADIKMPFQYDRMF